MQRQGKTHITLIYESNAFYFIQCYFGFILLPNYVKLLDDVFTFLNSRVSAAGEHVSILWEVLNVSVLMDLLWGLMVEHAQIPFR